MSRWATGFTVSVFLSATLRLCAQVSLPLPHSAQLPGKTVHPSPTPKQIPCYEVAGVSKAALDERRIVTQNANAQVEAVCANVALTPQQRAEEIRQIRQQQRTQLNSIITPQQQEAIKECNQARNPSRGAAASHHPAPGPARGPCGELLGAVATPNPHPVSASGTPQAGTVPSPVQPTNDSQAPPKP